MKKGLSLLLILLAIAGVLIAALPLLEIAEGNIDEVVIINEKGEALTDAYAAEKDGYVIKVGADPIETISPIGSIYLDSNSLLSIIDTEKAPVLYLVYGKMSIVPTVEGVGPITIYTPTTKTELNGLGEYIFVSTDEEEKFYNFTESVAVSYDSITGRTTEVPYLSGIDHLKKDGNVSEVSAEDYYAISNEDSIYLIEKKTIEPEVIAETFRTPAAPTVKVVSQILIPVPEPAKPVQEEAPAAEEIPAEPAPVVDDKLNAELFAYNIAVSIVSDSTSATITYPSNIITLDDLAKALNAIAPKYSDYVKYVTYRIPEEGTIILSYPELSKEFRAEAIRTVGEDILVYVDELFTTPAEPVAPAIPAAPSVTAVSSEAKATAPAVPAAPSVTAVSYETKAAVPAAPAIAEVSQAIAEETPIEDDSYDTELSAYGVKIAIESDSTSAIITYPSNIITLDDLAKALNAIAPKYSDYVKYVTYRIPEEGTIILSYPELSKEFRAEAIKVLSKELLAYVDKLFSAPAVPAAPPISSVTSKPMEEAAVKTPAVPKAINSISVNSSLTESETLPEIRTLNKVAPEEELEKKN